LIVHGRAQRFPVVPFNIRRFGDVKRLIRSRKLKKDRQQSGQEKKDKRTNNDLQNITQKTKDQATRTPLKTGEGVERGAQVLLIKDTKNMNYMSYPSRYS
jgi:hypothetical protein